MIRGLTDPLPINTAQRFLRLAGLWRQSATRRSGSLRGLSCDPVERRGPRAPRPTDGHIALLDRLGAAAGGVLGRGHLILSLATSIQIAPVPWLGWAAISLPAEPELILRIPCSRKSSNIPAPGSRPASAATCSGAPASRRVPSRLATSSEPSREAWLAGVTVQQCGDLLGRARRQQAAQQPGHAARILEGGMGRRHGRPARW